MTRLTRYAHDDKTEGLLVINNEFSFKTLELPWTNNKRNISCIPDGMYRYKIDFSNNKHRDVIELADVPGRSQIQIHVATKLSHLAGCIGVSSKDNEKQIFDLMGHGGIIIIETINNFLREEK